MYKPSRHPQVKNSRALSGINNTVWLILRVVHNALVAADILGKLRHGVKRIPRGGLDCLERDCGVDHFECQLNKSSGGLHRHHFLTVFSQGAAFGI